MARLRYFTVRGSGNFPFEMLARTESFPASIVEANKIRMSCPMVADEREVTLAQLPGTVRLGTEWAEARWPIKQTW